MLALYFPTSKGWNAESALVERGSHKYVQSLDNIIIECFDTNLCSGVITGAVVDGFYKVVPSIALEISCDEQHQPAHVTTPEVDTTYKTRCCAMNSVQCVSYNQRT